MVNGAAPGPAPVAQARASNSRVTRSSWRTWPQRKLRRNVPRVDGALTAQPRTLAVPPARNAWRRRCSHRPRARRRSGSAACPRRSPDPGQPRGRGGRRRAAADRDAGRAWPAAAAPRWPPGGRRRRPFQAGRGYAMIASNRCSLFRVDGLFTHHHPSFRGAPVCVSRQPNRVAGSVDPGLGRAERSSRCSPSRSRAAPGGIVGSSRRRRRRHRDGSSEGRLFGGALPRALPCAPDLWVRTGPAPYVARMIGARQRW